MNSIQKRLRASINIDAINGSRDERAVCQSQMYEAANQIDALEARIAELEAAQSWVPVSERLPDKEEFPDDMEIRGTWKSATGVVKSTEMLAKHLREFPSHYLAWQPLPKPFEGCDL